MSRRILRYVLLTMVIMVFVSPRECYGEEDNKKVAYLTFDDGPSEVTQEVLKVLEKYDVKGTFFIVGSKALQYDYVIREMHARGHSIGNHSYSHNCDYLYSNEENFIREVVKTEKLLNYIVPENKNKIFRFPYGSFKYKRYRETVERLGYSHYNWHLDAGDSGPYVKPAEELVRNILKDVKYDKSVVLFHDSMGKNTTPVAVEWVIKELKNKGYTFDILNEKTLKSF